MSYKNVPIFQCAICGRAETAKWWLTFSRKFIVLPEGWSGSRRMDGDCYCKECTEAIRKVRDGQ